MLGTPEAEAAIDPRNCPRCDHYEGNALTGGVYAFRGVDSELFVAPSALPAVVDFAAVAS